ncbi:MAG: hypothetical protein ACFFCV_07860 [Promethearchaeota archaeon]
MSFNSKVENFKNKKNLIEELNYYKSIILKKVKNGDYNSALEKVRSALILLQEHKESFNIEKELLDFYNLSEQIQSELNGHRMIYKRRFDNLLREKLNETNLENFSKLLAMLKNDVDHNLDRYHLQDLSIKITKYFKYIKKMYEILSCYKILNYYDASDKIFEFVRDIRGENFPNLKMLISLTYQNLISHKLYEFSKDFNKLTLSNLSKKMAMNQEQLSDFINIIKKQPKGPVQDYLPKTQEIIFKR